MSYDRISDDVVQHPYRTALVGDVFMELPREVFLPVEKKLAEKAGTRPDNHTVYEVTHETFTGNGMEKTYISCSDFTVTFGRSITLGTY